MTVHTDTSIDADIEAILPLTPMQQGMLFHSLLEPEAGHYIQCTVASLPAGTDLQALQTAWQQLVARHGVLRTVFLWEDLERPLQIVGKQGVLDWQTADWRDKTEAEAADALQALVTEQVQRGFALDRAPLMRVMLVQMPDQSWRQVWTYHHILLDGWSLPILFDELSALYSSLVGGTGLTLNRPVPFGDFIAWTQRQDSAASERFWAENLKGLAGLTPLPTEPKGQASAHAETIDIELGSRFSETLRGFARTLRITPNTLMQAAWALTLSTLTGETDVLFGGTVSGRPAGLDGVETMVGPFINSLPIRIAIRDGAKVRDWLAELQAGIAEREPHSHCALIDIQRLAGFASGGPLFDTLLVYENYPLGKVLGGSADRLGLSDFDTRERTNLKLTINVIAAEAMAVRFAFDPAQLRRQSVVRMAHLLEVVLRGLVADPDMILGDLPLLDAADEAKVRALSHGPSRTYPVDQTLHSLIEAQVERTPNALAAIYETETLSYRALNARANRLAHSLRDLGAGPGVLVAVYCERSLEMVVALLAVMKSGAAYVPVDPGYPADRVAYMLADAQAPVVLTQARLRPHLPAGEAKVLVLDGPEPAWMDAAEANPVSGARADDLAYVIYTSGSTGQPKGAMNSHRGIVNRLCWMQEEYGLTANDRVLQKTPFSFDVSVWEFFWPLLTGAALVLARPGGHRDNTYLTELIRRDQITTVHFVPSMLQAMLDDPTVKRCDGLKRVICSGEALTRNQVERFFATLPGVELHNLYGPTECAVDVTAWPLETTSGTDVPIGRPVANTAIYVLDQNKRLVPPGVAGEIYIGGIQVGAGYWRKPELSADRFVKDPVSAVPGARMYRTGDNGRWLENGALDYLGRRDGQVKIRGFRIETGEIEAVIRGLPGLRDVAVVARQDREGDRRLVAYLVSESATPLSTADIRAALATGLPDYMIPAAFVWMGALPLSVNGKLDRKALPQPEYESSLGYAAPRTATEAQLAQILAGVLGLEKVGIHDSFFELGGDSILLLQVISRARAAALPLTARQIFDHPTVAELARLAEAAETRPPANAGAVRTHSEAQLTPIQRWFMDQGLANPHHFNQSAFLEVPAGTPRDAVQQALDALLARHGALRLRINTSPDGTPALQIAGQAQCDLDSVELYGNESDIDRIAEAGGKAQAGLDLSDGPVVRAVWFESGTDMPSSLLLVAHHMAVDGVSWNVLKNDFASALGQTSKGVPVQWPTPATQFTDWAQRLAQRATSEVVETQESFWRTLEARDDGRLPLDLANGTNTFGNAKTIEVALDADRTRRLLQVVPKFYQSQINDVLLAALAQALADWTGRREILINLEGHGREDLFADLDLTGAVGWFTSLFPVALIASDEGPEAQVDAIKRRLRALPERGVGYGLLRYRRTAGGTWRDPALCFNYLGQSAGQEDLPAGQLSDARNIRAHQIDVIGEIRDGIARFSFTFGRGLHHQSTIDDLAAGFATALCRIIDHAAIEDTAPAAAGPDYEPLVTIQTGDRLAEPLFCVPGIGGSVIYFSPLAQRLGAQTPVHGLQPRGLDDDLSPHTTIGQMADAYVDAVLRLKPERSRRIRLLGHSLGAMVVFEMARRLQAMGFDLAPLILLDPPTLQEMTADRFKPDHQQMLDQIAQFLTNRYGRLFEIGEAEWNAMSEDERIEFLRQRMVSHKLISARTPFAIIKSKVRMVMAHGQIDFWPSGIYPGPAAILRPTRDFARDGVHDRDPVSGWIRFAPQLEVRESDGDHMTILDHVTMNALMANLTEIWGLEHTMR